MNSITFQNVTKQFHKGPRYLPNLRELVSGRVKKSKHSFTVLDNVSFQIKMGEVVGFIGANGAGKTTILKLISKVTFPNSGRITTVGNVAGLLELGAGFHPELTGRENIIFNGMLLGMSKQQMENRFEEIVDFAGIDESLDSPIKHYSSGMKARIGFAVSALINPDILLVDEVLAVGDEEFQRKCFKLMKDICADSQKTVVFVSHDLKALKTLCTRLIYIKDGQIAEDGDPSTVLNSYLREFE